MMLYRYKRSAEGNVIQRKARCNLRGDLMKPGLHYNPNHTTTFTADRTTQRMMIALHATSNLPLEHYDIKSAYLHEKYAHDRLIYVKQMQRFDGSYKHNVKQMQRFDGSYKHNVKQMQRFDGSYKHNRTYGQLIGNLYGSPPAAYYYNQGLQQFLASTGYTCSEHDPCLYTKITPHGYIIVSTTIDDFLVLASRQNLIDDLHDELLCKYKIKRLGTPTRFLNWTITRTENATHISQPDTIDALLHQTGMHHCNPTSTPYNNLAALDQHPPTKQLSSSESTKYRQILGEIRYITDSTRPDIAYATNRLAQHMSKPHEQHNQALESLVRYLKGTRTHGLMYTASPPQTSPQHPLTVYSDADFANEKTRKSITGSLHYIGNNPVSWASRMQNVIALSTTEAEYIAATEATRHTQWLTKLLYDAQTRSSIPVSHFIDNCSAILIARNQAPTKRRKYIDIRHHYLQHHVADKTITIHRIPTTDMKADIFTKPLHRERFIKLREAMQVLPRPQQK